jgi:integrase
VKSRRAAELALARLVTETGFAQPAAGTVSAHLTRWMDHITRQGRAVSTLDEYGHKIRLYTPAIGSKPLDKVTGADLDALYAGLQDRGLAPTTIRAVHSILRAAMHQAVRWGTIPANPTARATPPPLNQHEQHPPTADQLRSALAAADAISPQARMLVRLAAATGARRGELAALRWSDVDLTAGTLTIAEAIDRDGSRKPTKTRTVRTVTLDPGTATELADEHARQAAVATTHSLPFGPDEPILASWPGEAYTPAWMTRTWTTTASGSSCLTEQTRLIGRLFRVRPLAGLHPVPVDVHPYVPVRVHHARAVSQ